MRKINFSKRGRLFALAALLLVCSMVLVGADYRKNPNRADRNSGPSLSVSVDTGPTDLEKKIKEFGIKIDKIKIIAPVVKDVEGADKESYMESLKGGVAHYKGTALPGERGNIFIFGHSSSDLKVGDYWKIFASLNDLEKEDEIIIYYQNKEFKYKVTAKKIVEADDLSVLEKGKKEKLTLMTCWPVGTKEKRLVVVAERSGNDQ